jgi:S1-C subfamily serine protease
MKHGYVRRGWIGIGAQNIPLQRRISRYHDIPNTGAVLVIAIEPNSPAQIAGLRTGDAIVSLNDHTIEDADDLHRILLDSNGQPASLGVIRHSELIALSCVPDLR